MAYNGWTNRATWLVNLWVGDNLAETISDTGEAMDANAVESFVSELLDFHGNTVENGLAQDLLCYALADVNWHEIAESANEGALDHA